MCISGVSVDTVSDELQRALSTDGREIAVSHQGTCESTSEAEGDCNPLGLASFDPPEPIGESRTEPESLKLETRGVTSHPKQAALWQRETIYQQSILAKLASIGRKELAGKMADCHSIKTFKRCTGCQKTTAFFNRCELFFCPVCQPRLSRERKDQVEWWTKQINQPKHIVLTVRNTFALTKVYVQNLKKALGKLRRQNVFAGVRGGFYTLEVTNEGRGWHLHFHLLVDAPWVQASSLAVVWGKLVGQDYAIVKVKDCRGDDYLREVTKYAVKGSMLAGWQPEEIAEFVTAFDGVRMFGVFGSLYAKRTEWAEWIKAIREIKPLCACGCDSWRLLSPEEVEWESEVGGPNAPPSFVLPIQVSNNQVEMPLGGQNHFAWKH